MVTTCPHRKVRSGVYRGGYLRHMCLDCQQYVKPAAWVLESQPLPDELALMDFAASVTAARQKGER